MSTDKKTTRGTRDRKGKAMNKLEQKRFRFQLKEVNEEGRWSGYANVTEYRDSGGDIVHRGAFKRTIDHNNGRFPVLAFHDPTRDIGVALVDEDEKGLNVVEGILNLDTQEGRDQYAKLKFYREHGLAAEMSIGYIPINPRMDATGTRHIDEIKLKEISLLPPGYAMNDRSLVRFVKTDDELKSAEEEIAELRAQLDAMNERIDAALSGLAAPPASDPSAEHSDAADPSGTTDDSPEHSSGDDELVLEGFLDRLNELMEALNE